MNAFSKQLRYLDHTRLYSIEATDEGWQVREERDSQLVRQTTYQDWHRVERVTRAIAMELDELRTKGWVEVATSQTQ
jgi:hypothetical protein